MVKNLENVLEKSDDKFSSWGLGTSKIYAQTHCTYSL